MLQTTGYKVCMVRTYIGDIMITKHSLQVIWGEVERNFNLAYEDLKRHDERGDIQDNISIECHRLEGQMEMLIRLIKETE